MNLIWKKQLKTGWKKYEKGKKKFEKKKPEAEKQIESGKASFMLTNFGFASPYYCDMKIYVDGKEVQPDSEFSALDLVQFGQQIYSFDYNGGSIEVEIFNTRDGGKVRLFNDVEFTGGKNVIFRG